MRAGGSSPDDPRIERVAQALESQGKHNTAQDDGNSVQLFKSVVTGRRVLSRLTSPPINLPYDLAVERLTGTLIGPDGHQTCVLVTLTDEAEDRYRELVGRSDGGWFRFRRSEGLILATLRQCQVDPATARLGGPPVDNVAIDQEGERTLVRLGFLAGFTGLLLAWWSLRSVRLTAIVFTCGLWSAAASLAAVHAVGQQADAIVMSMPGLIYVLAISGAIHLINYYQDAVRESGVADAPLTAIRHGWKPALLCNVTTAFGLLSLCTSDLTPVRKFGVFSAIGLMLMLVVLFIFLPTALQLWPVRPAAHRKPEHAEWSALVPFWHRFGNYIMRHHLWVAAASLLIIVAISCGIGRVRTSIDLLKLFDSNARILHDYAWLEEHVGRLVPMEVVLRFTPGCLESTDGPRDASGRHWSFVQRMEIVQQVQEAVESRFGATGENIIGPSLSAVDFVPQLPSQQRGSASSVIRRRVANARLLQSYPTLSESGYLQADNRTQDELWRISLRVAAFRDVDYGVFANQVRSLVDPIVQRRNAELLGPASSATPATGHTTSYPAMSAVYTGVVPIVYKAQRALLNSLVQSTCWSFLTITPLLMFVARGARAGLIAMLPNVLPVVVVFGGMGWLSLPVDIGSMMAASIALGVAVDDTIHYLTWFRADLAESGDRRTAILAAYQRCATPTLQAALVNGFGLSVFAFSTFTPTKQFGYLMLTILLAGVLAELVLLPALLASPLGRVFGGKRPPTAVKMPDKGQRDENAERRVVGV